MRTELANTPGYWWHRIGSDFYFRNAFLAEGDDASNYEQVTDAEYEAVQASQQELTDTEALNIITGQDNE